MRFTLVGREATVRHSLGREHDVVWALTEKKRHEKLGPLEMAAKGVLFQEQLRGVMRNLEWGPQMLFLQSETCCRPCLESPQRGGSTQAGLLLGRVFSGPSTEKAQVKMDIQSPSWAWSSEASYSDMVALFTLWISQTACPALLLCH